MCLLQKCTQPVLCRHCFLEIYIQLLHSLLVPVLLLLVGLLKVGLVSVPLGNPLLPQ